MDESGSPTGLPVWKRLVAHRDEVRDLHLRTLFAEDPDRASRYSLDAVGLHLD